jgi:ABC-2 type transport system ATP-binding protein
MWARGRCRIVGRKLSGGDVATVVEVDNLVKRYDGRTVVDGISFQVEEGEVFVLVGPNGAGKTTTVESIAGLRRPDDGAVRVLGLDPWRGAGELRHRVGVQLQESRFADRVKVGELLELFASFYRHPRPVTGLLDELGLAEARHRRFAKLSGGEQQRLSIAVALVGDPDVVILDELSTGLDPVARREAWSIVERLRDRGVTVVLVTHFMEEAERLADRVALLDAGRLVAVDTPGGLVDRAGGGRRLTFRSATPFPSDLLGGLDEVAGVEVRGDPVVVTGTGDLLAVVTSELARNGIVAERLQIDQVTLDDAFVSLTGGLPVPVPET